MCGIWTLLSKRNIKLKDFGEFYSAFMKIKERGPDYSRFDMIKQKLLIGFHRLSIIDLSANGHQPFIRMLPDRAWTYLTCNGEIYEYKQLKQLYHIRTKSNSDCEIILPLYEKFGIDKMIGLLGSEFAFTLTHINPDGTIKIIAARDPIGVRPLFYGVDDETICFSSEIKGLYDIYDQIFVFPPGHYAVYENGKLEFTQYYCYEYKQLTTVPPIEEIHAEIRSRFINCVRKRLISDRPFGALLSGGLDSSLVCGIIKYLNPNSKFPVFTIAFKNGSTDLPHAKKVSEFLDLEHNIIEIDEEEALKTLDETPGIIGSFDITTNRASSMQLMLARWIQKYTKIRVLFCGENSDECHYSYKYHHNAPSPEDARNDGIRLVKNVHTSDIIRTDRTMANAGLEIRAPFSDPEYVDYIMSLPAELVAPQNNMEKTILRNAFRSLNILPDSVLMRRKDAFSDSVSKRERSWYQIIKEHIDKVISDEEFEMNKNKFKHCAPFTKEAYYYRKRFVEYYGYNEYIAKTIPYFWMPKWSPDTNDPSARTIN